MIETEPRVFLSVGAELEVLRRQRTSGDPGFRPAFARLDREAAEALTAGPWSVMDKKRLGPSEDRHDYVGMAGYWWPNPDTEDGLPYVPRDGQVNPESHDFDIIAFRSMAAAVETLSAHAYFSGSAESGHRAAFLLQRWFVDPETRMNPHLEYAAYTPGVWDGAGWGIVSSHVLVGLIERISLLRTAGFLPEAVDQGLMKWFRDFLDWLLHSEQGKFEADRPNNHSTSYDAQVMTLALHLGETSIARAVAEAIPYRRIGIQLEHNGQQPWEVARTKSWGYSSGNLLFLMHLADLSARVGVDVWGYATGDGRSIRRSFDYMLPCALGRQEWPWEVIGGWVGAEIRWVEILRRASRGFGESSLDELAFELDQVSEEQVRSDRVQLLLPQK